jgi:exopolysaccharide production protein ExoZ
LRKLRSIQVLRAIAACAVALLHSYQNLGMPAGREGYGAFGVDLFFVLSGFIMANVAEGRTAGAFLRDRLWRIYPMWWLALLPWLLLLPRSPIFIVSSLTLWPIYGNEYYVPVLQVGWTLSFELLFYAAMALALRTRAWVPLAIYGICLVGAMTTSSALFHFIGNPVALEFLMGVAIAKLPRRAAFGLLAPVGVLLLALTSPVVGSAQATLGVENGSWRALEWGAPAALIVWGALSLEPWFKHRLFDVPVAIGDASYALYLFHPLVAYGLDFPWPVRLLIAIFVGWCIHWLVERRILALRQRNSDSGRRLAPSLTVT